MPLPMMGFEYVNGLPPIHKGPLRPSIGIMAHLVMSDLLIYLLTLGNLPTLREILDPIKRLYLLFLLFVLPYICWKTSIEWIRNWRLSCSLEDVIKNDENPEPHIGKERHNIWVYMLIGRTLGWALTYLVWALLSK